MTPERLSQLDRPLKGLLTEEDPSLIDRLALIKAPPCPDRVKAFESKADRIHMLVTRCASRICPVLFEADPERRVLIDLFDEAFDVWRRRRRCAAEERLQDPLPSLNRGGPCPMGGRAQPRRVAQDSEALTLGQRDPSEALLIA